MTARLSVTRIFCWHLAAIAALGTLNLAVLAGDAAGYHGMLGFSSSKEPERNHASNAAEIARRGRIAR